MTRFHLLTAALLLPVMAAAEGSAPWHAARSFDAMSRTADSITGPIRLSGQTDPAQPGHMEITFGNGTTVGLTSAGTSSRRWNDTSETAVTGEVFRLDRDPGLLENGNTLCGAPDPARYLVFHGSEQPGGTKLLSLTVFSSEAPPEDIDSPGLCGTFNYYQD